MGVLFTEYDDFALNYMSYTFQHCNMDFSPLPVIYKNSAKNIQTPISVFAAEKDIMFPGKKMIKRAEDIFPSLEEVVLLEGSKHVPGLKDFKNIEELILYKSA